MPQATKKHPHNFDVPWSWIDRDEVIEEFDDDWWIDDQTFDHTTIIVVWILPKWQPDDEDDDWVNSSLITDDYPVDVIVIDDPADENDVDAGDWFYTRQSDLVFDVDHINVILDEQIDEVPPDEDADWFYTRQSDLVFDTDQVYVILDDQIYDVEPDADDDYTYARQDQDLVTDFDHVIVILDDQIDDYPLDTDDEWYLDKLVDAAVVVSTPLDFVILDEDLGIELLDDDDDWQNLPFDQVYDTDQIFVIVDEDDRVDEDDDWTYRLDDLVYDTDQVFVVVDDDPDPDPYEDDWAQAINEDVISLDYTSTIVVFWFLIRNELDDEDDVYIGYVETPPSAADTGEYIANLYDLDFESDPDDDDRFDSYGIVESPDLIFGLGGRYITEEEVEEELFEFLKPVDYPEKLHFPDSSHIETVLYDKKSGEMQIKFKEGSTYKYEGVKPNKFKGIGRARSTGTYFHNKIKPIHPGKKM